MIETLLQVTDLSGTTIYLDLYDDVSINFNLSFAEIQDITSRNSGYSQTFRVPGTPKNNQFFNYMFNVNQEGLSFDLQKSVICSVNYKGIEMLSGILRLLKIIITDNKVDYEVNIQDEVGVFINKISNKLLIDIDYTDLDHSYISTNVKDSWDATYSVTGTTGGLKDGQILYPFAHIGYIYNEDGVVVKTGNNSSPLLELNQAVGSISNVTTPMRTTGFKPSIQIYSVLQRIFQQNGYNVESEFFATEYFQRLYMPLLFNSETYYINSPEGTDGTSQVTTISTSTPVAFNVSGSSCLTIKGYVDFDSYVFNNGAPASSGYGWQINGRFYPWTGGDYTFSYSLDLRLPPFEDPNTTEMMGDVYFYKNRTTAYNIKSFSTVPPETSKIVSRQNVVITLAPGDFVELVVEWQQGNIGGCGSYKSVAPDVEARTSVASVTDAPNLVVGSTVVVGDQFTPEYKQLDFLKGLITQFNLVFVKHPYLTDTYIMEPYNDYVGQGDTLNWTDKLDVSKSIEISPITNMVGKAIDFVYKDDADSTNVFTKSINNNRTFGTFNFIPSGVTLNDNPIKFESFFSPSPLDILTYGGTPNPFLVPQFYGVKQLTVSGTTITQLLPMKLKPRILHYGGIVPSNESWYYYDDVATTTIEYSSFPFLSHQNIIPSTPTGQAIDLNFGNSSSPQDTYASTTTTNTAYNLYYKDYIDDLLSEEARMVSANFFLNIEDIQNLKYSDLIFVKDAFYRINKIGNYNLISNQSNRVELIKLLNVDITSINPIPVDIFCNLQTELVENIQDELENNLGPQQCDVPYPPTPTPVTPTPTPTGTPTPTPTPTISVCYDFKSGYYNSSNGLPPTIIPGAIPSSRIREIKYKNNKLYVGGNFNYYQASSFITSGITQTNFSVINLDGSVNNSFINSGFTISGVGVASIEVLSNDKILVGGGLTQYGATNFRGMCRLNSDGTFDSSWNSGGSGFSGLTSSVYDIEVDVSNNIWVGGSFSTYNATSSACLIKLNSDGSINTSFGTNIEGQVNNKGVWDIQILPDNTILCGGDFTGYTGTNANSLIKLNTDNSLNTTFTTNFYNIGFDAAIFGIGVQSTGKIILVGSFYNLTYPNGIGIIRINADGTLDNTFPIISSATDQVGANNLLVLSNDKFYVNLFYQDLVSGSQYANYNRYNSDGTVDSSFTTNTFTNAFQNTASNENTCLIPNGDVIVGSCFNRLNGNPLYNIAAFNSVGTIRNCSFIGPAITPTPTPTNTPTPTVTPTPTPTSGVTYDYYTADVFPCNDCSTSIDTILVAFVAGSVVTLNRFYIPLGGPDTNSYRVVASASPGVAFILTTSYGSFGTCATACSV